MLRRAPVPWLAGPRRWWPCSALAAWGAAHALALGQDTILASEDNIAGFVYGGAGTGAWLLVAGLVPGSLAVIAFSARPSPPAPRSPR